MPSIYLGVILIGLVHGLEPGHGWPVAALYSLRQEKKLIFALISSLLLSFFHFISSIAVVIIFILVNKQFDLSSSPLIRVLGAMLLFYMAYRLWTEHGHHTEEKKKVKNLKEIVMFAFVLGFAHEEEFALLAFCLNNVNCLLMMASYALAVTFSLVSVTLLAVYGYERIKHKVEGYEHYLPKISAVILFIFASLYLIKLL
ncbi:MAG TPA: hypothetical protein DD725_12650 [Deltaproteobacteria bacterium]|nr:hypothetical protein [Deltaproteobacteria bacterium]